MRKVLILGGNGMLGAALVRWFAAQPDLAVQATNRAGLAPAQLVRVTESVKWAALDVDHASVASLTVLCSGFDLVINAIGRIKQRICDTSLMDREIALRANALFAVMLARAAEATGCKVVQIATDCVYSGASGHYVETDRHDATDLYGLSKSLGEVVSPNVINLRCSIVGLELASSFSLLNWFLAQKPNATIQGYTNHYWNGVTTLHFSKICHGLLNSGWSGATNAHVVPADSLTKFELLQIFARNFSRMDITIVPIEVSQSIDHTLSTTNFTLNTELWRNAGYFNPPTIKDMIKEFACYAASCK
jgi:dTDP-4-dehydrorhamnose reductase